MRILCYNLLKLFLHKIIFDDIIILCTYFVKKLEGIPMGPIDFENFICLIKAAFGSRNP